MTDILDGRWIAFGHLQLQLDDPPQWHKDYLAGVDMATDKPALKCITGSKARRTSS